jgi:hypothetical protein
MKGEVFRATDKNLLCNRLDSLELSVFGFVHPISEFNLDLDLVRICFYQRSDETTNHSLSHQTSMAK